MRAATAVIGWLAAALAASVSAGEPQPPPLTLAQALALARDPHPTLLAARLRPPVDHAAVGFARE